MDAVAAVRARRKDRASLEAPRCIYRCSHCDFRSDRVTAAWCHGLLHGYGRN